MNFKRYHVSKNLWDESQYNESIEAGTIVYVPVYVGDIATVVCSTTAPKGNNPDDVMASRIIFLLAGNVSTGAQNKVNGVSINAPRAVTPINGYVTIAYRWVDMFEPVNNWKPWNHQTMLNTGLQPFPYEPYSSEVWHDTPHYIHNTSTDTLTTLPADIYANDTTATVGLKGQMEQSGTPTPTNPIQPQECGERTGNLFDGNYVNAYLTVAGEYFYPDNTTKSIIIPCDGNTTYTIKQYGTFDFHKFRIATFTEYPTNNSQGSIFISDDALYEYTFTTGNNDKYIVYYCAYPYTTTPNLRIMVNVGSTALPYEPYGIKIPILSGGVTTPVYLGEVQSTRRIQKVVFTGGVDETWNGDSLDNKMRYYPRPMIANGVPLTEAISTHFAFGGFNANSGANGTMTGTNSSSAYRMYFWSSDYATVDAWKSFLAQQYSAGTPVCVWYVLATPTTGIVNEPLRKIGTYADEVSGITIPTIAGENTLSVDTTLQPSEVSVNYKGWHPVEDVHEKSKNLFDYSTKTTGYRIMWTNGEPYADETAIMSDYIPVGIGNYCADSGYFIIGYDANKNYVGTYQNDSSWQKGVTYARNTFDINANSNVSFVKILSFSTSTPISSTTMLNFGSTALPYEPYWN